MGPLNVRRPSDKHLDNQELDALVPSRSESGPDLSVDAVREAARHMLSCEDCGKKLALYRQLIDPQQMSSTPQTADCPNDEDVDWYEVSAGLWPELKARQLVMHASQCDHCGPRLRAALSIEQDPTPEEQIFLAQLKKPSRPVSLPAGVPSSQPRWLFARWLVPAAAVMLLFAMLRGGRSSHATLSGPEFATLAVNTYKQQAQGTLALDVHVDSEQALNDWLKVKSGFAEALPSSPVLSAEERPFRIEGARLLPVAHKSTVAYIAYAMQSGPVGLVVAPDSVSLASGGVVADFKKVSFHYRMVQGYKVVTWSIHGMTYALISREGSQTQQSCMVCHSAMGDRDLSRTPTPLGDETNLKPQWQ